MPTFKEKYEKETDWVKKIILIDIFHHTAKAKDEKWIVRDTAGYFDISMGLASENLKLARNLDKLEGCNSRKQALKKLRGL